MYVYKMDRRKGGKVGERKGREGREECVLEGEMSNETLYMDRWK